MKIGVGLPTIGGRPEGGVLLDWARGADAAGYSSLAVLDRLVYSNLEPLIALAAAASVTAHAELVTSILVAPLRSNAALLAKQLASIDVLSGGRVVAGLAAGSRADDYEVSHVDIDSRGAAFDALVNELAEAWGAAGPSPLSQVGPKPAPGRPTVMFGGTGAAAFRRTATRGDGWIMGGGGPQAFASSLAQLDAAWSAAGRKGRPRTAVLAYFALGPDAQELAATYLGNYYAFLGQQAVSAVTAGAATSPEAVVARVRDFAAAGCDEVLFIPCSDEPDQLARLSDVALPLQSAAADLTGPIRPSEGS